MPQNKYSVKDIIFVFIDKKRLCVVTYHSMSIQSPSDPEELLR